MSVYTKFGGGRPDTASRSALCFARPSQYAPNGTGRDSYIAMDNGGLYAAYEPAYNPDTGTIKARKQYRAPYSSIEAKHTNYTSNGTGRDGYIW
jgi:hypothetical protein